MESGIKFWAAVILGVGIGVLVTAQRPETEGRAAWNHLLAGRSEASDAKCRRAEKRLEQIKERMRRGYRSSEADRLHRRELKAREARRRYCE